MNRPRNTTIALVVLTVLALGYIFSVPVQDYRTQQADTGEAESQLGALDERIAELETRRAELADPAAVERAAREDFGLGYPGEEVFAVLPAPPESLPIPSGWPFDVLRGAQLARTGQLG